MGSLPTTSKAAETAQGIEREEHKRHLAGRQLRWFLSPVQFQLTDLHCWFMECCHRHSSPPCAVSVATDCERAAVDTPLSPMQTTPRASLYPLLSIAPSLVRFHMVFHALSSSVSSPSYVWLATFEL